jgi:predicted homoserine dehydrogenase-like protein
MVVANAIGLQPDRMGLHAPLARINEVPTIFSRHEDGGILGGDRRIEVFHCLRKPDEISFAGGVFVIIRCDDSKSWDMLAQKGHIVSRTGANAMVFLPRHLLGLEAATSILDAAIHNVSGYGSDYRPRYDLIAVAIEDLPVGTVLSMGGHHHTISGVTAEFRPAEALVADAPAPFYLAADCRLSKAVRKGEEIRMSDLELPDDSVLLALRRRQDARFFGQ